ncbi:hypothetical protein HDU84_005581 [Entophlyctis sp. JEL0112]|nr:hypothetical protein HDU84_005581 [Entophlyctis sp. JEL0112]
MTQTRQAQMKIAPTLTATLALALTSATTGSITGPATTVTALQPPAVPSAESPSPALALNQMKLAQPIPRRCGPDWPSANEFCFGTCLSDADCGGIGHCWDGLLLACSDSNSPDGGKNTHHGDVMDDGRYPWANSYHHHPDGWRHDGWGRDASKRDWSQGYVQPGDHHREHNDHYDSSSNGRQPSWEGSKQGARGNADYAEADHTGSWYPEEPPQPHSPDWPPHSPRNFITKKDDDDYNHDYHHDNDDGHEWHGNSWSEHHDGHWWWNPSHWKRDVRRRR